MAVSHSPGSGAGLKAIDKARQACAEQNLKAEGELVDFFKGEGMIIIEDPDRAAFAEYAKNSYLTESKEISKVMDALKKKGKIASPKRCYWEPA